jgi:hypothetical protein
MFALFPLCSPKTDIRCKARHVPNAPIRPYASRVWFSPDLQTRPVQSDLLSRFRSAFLRDCSVCFHNGIVESPTGYRAHTIETGEDA